MNSTNLLANYYDIMEYIRTQENKGKVPHILCAEPRIGRNIDPEMIEFAKKIGNRDVLCGSDLLKFEMDMKGDRWGGRYYKKYVKN